MAPTGPDRPGYTAGNSATQSSLDIELNALLDDQGGESDRLMGQEYRDDPSFATKGSSTTSGAASHHRVGSRRRFKPSFCNLLLLFIIAILALALAYTNRDHIKQSGGKPQQVAESFSLSCLCPMTPTGKRMCNTYPPAAVKRSRIHEGTNARLKLVIEKLWKERKLNPDRKLQVGIMGGSVSACHGATKTGDNLAKECYGRIFGDWLSERLGGDMVSVRNGAIGGMDSGYYAFCGTNHLKQDVDIVILEFDSNDQPVMDYLIYYDQLLRVALEFPSQPAVILLGSWGPILSRNSGSMTPLTIHFPAALFYDLPYLSLQYLLYNTFLRFPHSVATRFFEPDMIHPNVRGHVLLADLLIGYMESILCELESEAHKIWDEDWTLQETWVGGGKLVVDKVASFDQLVHQRQFEPLSPGGLELNVTTYDFLSLPDPTSIPPIPIHLPLSKFFEVTDPDPTSWDHLNTPKNKPPVPFCADANDAENPLNPVENTGWRMLVWKSEKHFWAADTVGARIKVNLKAHEGRVAVYYFRSEHLSPGVAECWVDDNRGGAVRLEGYWEHKTNIPAVSYIDSELYAGDHYVTCEISKDSHDINSPAAHHFRIVAIMAT